METASDRSRVARLLIRSSGPSVSIPAASVACSAPSLLGSSVISNLRPLWGTVPNALATSTLHAYGDPFQPAPPFRGSREMYLKDSFCFLIGHSTQGRHHTIQYTDRNVSFTSTRKITESARQTPCLLDICISINPTATRSSERPGKGTTYCRPRSWMCAAIIRTKGRHSRWQGDLSR